MIEIKFTSVCQPGKPPVFKEFWKHYLKKTLASRVWKNDQNCHKFSISDSNSDDPNSFKLVAGEYGVPNRLAGPASTLDRTIIYSCHQNKCEIPCGCKFCTKASIDACLNCSECVTDFDDNKKFHLLSHTTCKFCVQCLFV